MPTVAEETQDHLRNLYINAQPLDVGKAREAERIIGLIAGDRADNHRIDFIRRFVSVAVSVGFAAAVAGYFLPAPNTVPFRWAEAVRIATAFFMVVAGWEWYHRDTDIDRPVSIFRFIFVDSAIVVLNLILLIAARYSTLSLLCWLAGLWIAYAAWSITCAAERRLENLALQPRHLQGAVANFIVAITFVAIACMVAKYDSHRWLSVCAVVFVIVVAMLSFGKTLRIQAWWPWALFVFGQCFAIGFCALRICLRP